MPKGTRMSAPVSSRPDPVSSLVQRLVASSGIIFAVLLVLSILIAGDTVPDDTDPLADWTTYARENEDNLRIAALVVGIAAYNFFLFLGYLRSVLGEAERAARGFVRGSYIVLAAGTAGIAGIVIALGLSAATTANPDTPPEVLKALNDFASGAWLLAAAGFGACFVTVGLINAAIRALPSWLGWVALGTGIAWVLQLGVLLSEGEDNLFGIFFPIGLVLLLIFTIGASVTFLRGQGVAATTPTTPPPAA